MIGRRRLAAGAGGIIVASAGAAPAQQAHPRGPRIGILDDGPNWIFFREAMRELGYVEGSTIAYEYRAADGNPERLAAAAAELARLPVDLFAVYGTVASRAAQSATTTIPIVSIATGDPVRAGLVHSLSQPGGNLTGNTMIGVDLGPKRLQLLRELIPKAARVACLWNPDNASSTAFLQDLRAAAPALALEIVSAPMRSAGEVDQAFALMLERRVDAFLMTLDPVVQQQISRIIAFMIERRVPAIFLARENALAGGLVSYGASNRDMFRHGASYVHRILQGARPSALPVWQPDRLELVFNLGTARALGIVVPPLLLARADEMIE
ncbi:MAG: ABC transporter substrate-binding protein [Alphaproteobacteria bacterium]|nr:ABC transporter substrate-binding protein [Alphaproteobacteria bacterium]